MHTYIYLIISVSMLVIVSAFTLVTTLSKWWFIRYCRFVSGIPGYICFILGITISQLYRIERVTLAILVASLAMLIALSKGKYR